MEAVVVATATSLRTIMTKNTFHNRDSEKYSRSQYSESEHMEEEQQQIIPQQLTSNEPNQQPYTSPMRKRVKHRRADAVISQLITIKNKSANKRIINY